MNHLLSTPTHPASTICAIATPAGGAIGIVRISGPISISAVARLFQPAGKVPWEEKPGSSLTFGRIVHPETKEIIDEVLVSLFRAPHSYTGEDCVEISCHGSQYILSEVLRLLLAEGCTMAQPGEYTQRAFLNGKLDLSQAEAVADLIASSTAANHRMAMQQMRGGFSNELRGLRDKLLHITSLLELELDFSDHEDLEFASRPELLDLAEQIHQRIARLCQSFKLGNALKQGLPVAIVGETNAGKSTLLNALVGEQRALVSNVHGTTRDTVEETVVVGDSLIRFIDTAGIRQTSDVVEQMGIERTFEKMDSADLILWILDATQAHEQYQTLQGKLLPHWDKVLLVINKTDLLSVEELVTLQAYFDNVLATSVSSSQSGVSVQLASPHILYISAHAESDVDLLRQCLSNQLLQLRSALASANDLIVSNARHYEALSQALLAINRVIEGLQNQLSGDFISQDLRECIHYLSDIVGEVTTDAVLQNIFKHFCIGK